MYVARLIISGELLWVGLSCDCALGSRCVYYELEASLQREPHETVKFPPTQVSLIENIPRLLQYKAPITIPILAIPSVAWPDSRRKNPSRVWPRETKLSPPQVVSTPDPLLPAGRVWSRDYSRGRSGVKTTPQPESETLACRQRGSAWLRETTPPPSGFSHV